MEYWLIAGLVAWYLSGFLPGLFILIQEGEILASDLLILIVLATLGLFFTWIIFSDCDVVIWKKDGE